MDRPTKLEVGQIWNWADVGCWRKFKVTEVGVNDDPEWSCAGSSLLDPTQHGHFSKTMMNCSKFLGWSPGYGPQQPQDPVANTTGQQAADWLRKVADVLVEKGKSYGDSIGNPLRIFSHVGVTEGVRVRIDDKLSRVARGKEWPGDDVIVDLVGYLALLAVTEKHS